MPESNPCSAWCLQECEVVTQHACAVTVAKYSPSGFYIASADKSGKIRIWDTVNKEHLTKSEYQPISGPIYDLCWSQDNQRIVCVGEGREKFGHVFLSDTGTSNGDITGQTRYMSTQKCAVYQQDKVGKNHY